MSKVPETQAARIIRICGIKNLADWTQVSETSVYRWDHAKNKGGCGGVIPSEHHQAILNGAVGAGVPLSPADFFETPAPADLSETLPAQLKGSQPVSTLSKRLSPKSSGASKETKTEAVRGVA